MDKLGGMKVFTKVARAGSFAAAAHELGISRAMVTKHIMQLENILGVRLLNRTTRHLSLTEVGSSYYERCLQVLDDIEEIELAVTQMQTEPRGTLKVSTPPFFGTYHLAPAISDYLKLHPDVSVELLLQGGTVDVIEAGLDLAIHLGELGESSLIARRLATSRQVVCGSPEYFAKHGVPQTPEDLKNHNCLFNWSWPQKNLWTFHDKHGNRIGVRVSGNLQANVSGALRLAAINGLGLVMLPTYMGGHDLRKGRLAPALIDYEPATLDILAVYPHRKHLSAKVRTFVDFLCNRYQPRPYWDDWMKQRNPQADATAETIYGEG